MKFFFLIIVIVALIVASLAETLSGNRQFTVFVPTKEFAMVMLDDGAYASYIL